VRVLPGVVPGRVLPGRVLLGQVRDEYSQEEFPQDECHLGSAPGASSRDTCAHPRYSQEHYPGGPPRPRTAKPVFRLLTTEDVHSYGMTRDLAAPLRYHAPYMEWAKTRPAPEFDLAGSNILACTLDDLPGAREAVSLSGANDNGYAPLIDAIADRYGTTADRVTTANGTSGANFLVFAALIEPGDDVLVERPGYDPLLGASRIFGARTVRFDRRFEDGFRLDPDRVRSALTPRTRLIVITTPHNPTGVMADPGALADIGAIAERAGAHVLVDEVYRDVTGETSPPAATWGDVFISTNSITKSYGLSSLRAGWVIAAPEVAYRVRRARDIVDGTGSIVAERLATLAFQQLDRLYDRARAVLARNKKVADEFLRSRRELEWIPSVGTIVFPRIANLEDATPFVEQLMQERRTAVGPGRFFEAPAHFSVGYGGDTEKIRAGLARLGAALDALAELSTSPRSSSPRNPAL